MHKCGKCWTIARIIFALPFLVFGLFHLIGAAGMVPIIPGWLPGPAIIYVYFSGLILIGGSLSILLNKYTTYGAYALIALIAIFIVTLHIPGLQNETIMQLSMVNLLKDFALIGGLLVYASLPCEDCKIMEKKTEKKTKSKKK